MATTTLLVALAPLAGAEDSEDADIAEWRCLPSADRSASMVSIGTATYYEKFSQNGAYYIQELWQEVNGEAGLQTSTGMSCIGKADKLVRSACVGVCPISF